MNFSISFIFTMPSSFHSFFRRKKQFSEMRLAVRWIKLLQIIHQCEAFCYLIAWIYLVMELQLLNIKL